MARIQCKGCNRKFHIHNTIGGYCILCAEDRVKQADRLQSEVEWLKEALNHCGLIAGASSAPICITKRPGLIVNFKSIKGIADKVLKG